MHIVYVTGVFAERDGEVLTGMPNYIYKVSKYMQSVGHDVTILCAKGEKKKWTYDSIPVWTVEVVDAVAQKNTDFVRYIVQPILREYTFNHALEEIHQIKPISLVQYAGWYGVGMLYNRKYPSVLRLSTYVKKQLYANHTKKQLAYITFTEKLASLNFNGILAPSKVLGTAYEKDVHRKVTIIETPFEYKSCEEDNSVLNSKIGSKKFFLFFGRISRDKGIGTIARCIKELLIQNPDYYFCFAGATTRINDMDSIQYVKKMLGV